MMILSKLKVSALAALLCSASACAPSQDNRTHRGLTVAESGPRFAAAAELFGQCPVTEPGGSNESATLVAGAMAVAVDFAVDFAISAIKQNIEQAKKNLTGTFLANGVASKDLEADGNCLVISRGLRGVLLEDVAEKSGRMSKQLIGKLGFADYPAFYLELKTSYQADVKVLTLAPVYLRYAESSALSAGSGKKNITLAIGLKTKSGKPGEDPEEGALAVFRHNLGRVDIGTELVDSAQPGIFTGAAASHTLGEEVGANVVALVTEAEDPGVALNALSDAFGDGKAIGTALKELIKDSISPDS